MTQYKTLKSDKLVDLIHIFWHQVSLSEHFILISCSFRLNIGLLKFSEKKKKQYLRFHFLRLSMQNPYSKIIFDVFFLFVNRFSFLLAAPFMTNLCPFLNTWAHFETIWIFHRFRSFQYFKKPMNRGSPRTIAHKSLTFKKWTLSWELLKPALMCVKSGHDSHIMGRFIH